MNEHSVSRPRAVRDLPCFGAPDLSMSDRRGHRYFTLSYERFLFPPDVFPGKFVMLCTWADGSRKGKR
jgi:hypothetical protein